MRGLVLACLVLSVLAIYKDEAGKYDWALTHVGQVVFADLILVKDRSRLLVQSSRGVLATLKMSGQVDWRKLPYGLDAHFQVLSTPGYVVTFEPKQEVLSAWDPEDGMLLWSQQVSGAKEVVLKQSLVSTHICVLLGETLLIINLGSGKVIHKVALGEGFTHIIRMEKLDILVVAKADPVLTFLPVNVEKGAADNIVHGKLQSPDLHITHSGLVATKGNRTEWLASTRLEAGDWPHEVTLKIGHQARFFSIRRTSRRYRESHQFHFPKGYRTFLEIGCYRGVS